MVAKTRIFTIFTQNVNILVLSHPLSQMSCK